MMNYQHGKQNLLLVRIHLVEVTVQVSVYHHVEALVLDVVEHVKVAQPLV